MESYPILNVKVKVLPAGKGVKSRAERWRRLEVASPWLLDRVRVLEFSVLKIKSKQPACKLF